MGQDVLGATEHAGFAQHFNDASRAALNPAIRARNEGGLTQPAERGFERFELHIALPLTLGDGVSKYAQVRRHAAMSETVDRVFLRGLPLKADSRASVGAAKNHKGHDLTHTMARHVIGIERMPSRTPSALKLEGIPPFSGRTAQRRLRDGIVLVSMLAILFLGRCVKTLMTHQQQVLLAAEHDERSCIRTDDRARCSQDVIPWRYRILDMANRFHGSLECRLASHPPPHADISWFQTRPTMCIRPLVLRLILVRPQAEAELDLGWVYTVMAIVP